jgi:hypothetical protein
VAVLRLCTRPITERSSCGATPSPTRALADLGDVPADEVDIEIPRELLRFADSPMTDDTRYITARQDSGEEDC